MYCGPLIKIYIDFISFMSKSVFITGANGYIAKHIIKQLLQKQYQVIGSVRSKSKGDLLIKQFSNSNFEYTIIDNFENPQSFEVLKNYPNVSIFIHTASPVYLDEKDVKKITIPAIQGTKNALASIKKYGNNITNLVLTSSTASVQKIHEAVSEITEEDWSDVTEEDASKGGPPAYSLSKKLAEKAAWEFIETEKPTFKLSVILPTFVFGPQAFDEDVLETLNLSAEIVNSIFTKQNLSLIYNTGNFIDVRDVAKAHIVAFEKNLHQRILLVNSEFDNYDIIKILKEEFPNRKYPQAEPYKKVKNVNSDKSKKSLGFEYIDLKTSVLESARQIETYEKTK